MRTVPQTLEDALATGCTSHCRCWSVVRNDGVVLGFTDHDRDLSFDAVQYLASTGFNAAAIEAGMGLSVDTHTVAGALSSAAITDEDIERGLFDGAEVTLWLVDWRDVSSRMLLSRGHIGEIRRGSTAFEAEIVSLAEALNQPYGRAFQHSCDLKLGEPRCGVDLASPDFRGTGTVTAVLDPQRFAFSGLAGFSAGWFNGGALIWTAGGNANSAGHVKTQLAADAGATIDLWLTPPVPIAAGDAFVVTAGCDKMLETCRDKFANLLNHRGFPHMPGDDWASGYVAGEGEHDGGSLFGR